MGIRDDLRNSEVSTGLKDLLRPHSHHCAACMLTSGSNMPPSSSKKFPLVCWPGRRNLPDPGISSTAAVRCSVGEKHTRKITTVAQCLMKNVSPNLTSKTRKTPCSSGMSYRSQASSLHSVPSPANLAPVATAFHIRTPYRSVQALHDNPQTYLLRPEQPQTLRVRRWGRDRRCRSIWNCRIWSVFGALRWTSRGGNG